MIRALQLSVTIFSGAIFAYASPLPDPGPCEGKPPKVAIPEGDFDIAFSGENLAKFQKQFEGYTFHDKELGLLKAYEKKGLETLLLTIGREKTDSNRYEIKTVKVFATTEAIPKAVLVTKLDRESKDFPIIVSRIEKQLKGDK